jgi:hypothetical protein
MKPYAVPASLTILLILLLVTGCTSPSGSMSPAVTAVPTTGMTTGTGDLHLVAADGNASLSRVGNISVIRLEGTYREMGRQYGRLMGKDIAKMYDTVVASIGQPGFIIGITSESQLVNYSMGQYRYYPQQYREIVEGISESSGVPVSHIVVIDQLVPDYITYAKMELTPEQIKAIISGNQDPILGNTSASPGTDHCSSITVWGNYTGGGPLVMGRNFDFGQSYRNFNPYLTVVVYNPTDGSVPTAVIGWPGSVGGIEAFNRAGLVMETNDNSRVTEPNNQIHIDRIPINFLVLGLVMDSSTFDQFDAAMESARFGYPLLANFATPAEGYTYEIGTQDVVRRGDTNYGMQVIANFPLAPYWNESPNLTDLETGISQSRRANLMNLGEKYKGSINTTVMEKVLDTQYTEGGATFGSGSLGSSVTVYQFIYVPATRTLTLKAPTYDTWTTVELAPLFRNG